MTWRNYTSSQNLNFSEFFGINLTKISEVQVYENCKWKIEFFGGKKTLELEIPLAILTLIHNFQYASNRKTPHRQKGRKGKIVEKRKAALCGRRFVKKKRFSKKSEIFLLIYKNFAQTRRKNLNFTTNTSGQVKLKRSCCLCEIFGTIRARDPPLR